jgi:hypothetical protein
VLAAEMESQFEREEQRTPEDLVRRRWKQAVARGERQRLEDEQRRRAEHAVKYARTQLPIARALEKRGKITAALKLYKGIAREAPDTEEGQQAAARFAALRTRIESP